MSELDLKRVLEQLLAARESEIAILRGLLESQRLHSEAPSAPTPEEVSAPTSAAPSLRAPQPSTPASPGKHLLILGSPTAWVGVPWEDVVAVDLVEHVDASPDSEEQRVSLHQLVEERLDRPVRGPADEPFLVSLGPASLQLTCTQVGGICTLDSAVERQLEAVFITQGRDGDGPRLQPVLRYLQAAVARHAATDRASELPAGVLTDAGPAAASESLQSETATAVVERALRTTREDEPGEPAGELPNDPPPGPSKEEPPRFNGDAESDHTEAETGRTQPQQVFPPPHDYPADDYPSDDYPSDHHPADHHPADDHPADDHPADDHPADDHPADDYPPDDHPPDDYPADEDRYPEGIQSPGPPRAYVAVGYLPARVALVRQLRQAGWRIQEDASLDSGLSDRISAAIPSGEFTLFVEDSNRLLPGVAEELAARFHLAASPGAVTPPSTSTEAKSCHLVAVSSRFHGESEPRPWGDAPRLAFPFADAEVLSVLPASLAL